MFTRPELQFLDTNELGRLATITPDGDGARCGIFDSQLGTGLNLDSRNERKYSSFGCHYSSCKLTRAC